jgi:hypothetical protein
VLYASKLINNSKKLRVHLVALSGMAASHIDGCTIHTFFGLGHVSERSKKEDVWAQVKVKQPVVQRLLWTDALVIDEGVPGSHRRETYRYVVVQAGG